MSDNNYAVSLYGHRDLAQRTNDLERKCDLLEAQIHRYVPMIEAREDQIRRYAPMIEARDAEIERLRRENAWLQALVQNSEKLIDLYREIARSRGIIP